jgi:hypothetical protein
MLTAEFGRMGNILRAPCRAWLFNNNPFSWNILKMWFTSRTFAKAVLIVVALDDVVYSASEAEVKMVSIIKLSEVQAPKLAVVHTIAANCNLDSP